MRIGATQYAFFPLCLFARRFEQQHPIACFGFIFIFFCVCISACVIRAHIVTEIRFRLTDRPPYTHTTRRTHARNIICPNNENHNIEKNIHIKTDTINPVHAPFLHRFVFQTFNTGAHCAAHTHLLHSITCCACVAIETTTQHTHTIALTMFRRPFRRR